MAVKKFSFSYLDNSTITSKFHVFISFPNHYIESKQEGRTAERPVLQSFHVLTKVGHFISCIMVWTEKNLICFRYMLHVQLNILKTAELTF